MLDLLNDETKVRRLLKYVSLVTTTGLPAGLDMMSESISHRSAIDEASADMNFNLSEGPVCAGPCVADALEPRFFKLTAPVPGMQHARQACCQDCGARVSNYELAEAWALRHCSATAEEAYREKTTEHFEVDLLAARAGDLQHTANLTLIALAHCVHLPGHTR
jgi:hypothetical protein